MKGQAYNIVQSLRHDVSDTENELTRMLMHCAGRGSIGAHPEAEIPSLGR